MKTANQLAAHTKHGDAGRKRVTAEYRAYCTMKRRCYEKKFISFNNYGGRGIKVCPQWMEKDSGYIKFLTDIGRKPSPEYTLDRIDVNGDYTPENVRWATRKTQARNTRTTHYLIYNGIKKSLPEWAEEYGMKLATLHKRIYIHKYPIEKSLMTPVRHLGTSPNSKKIVCPKNHPYSGENLINDGGGRRCRICKNETARKYAKKINLKNN